MSDTQCEKVPLDCNQKYICGVIKSGCEVF